MILFGEKIQNEQNNIMINRLRKIKKGEKMNLVTNTKVVLCLHGLKSMINKINLIFTGGKKRQNEEDNITKGRLNKQEINYLGTNP